MAKKKPTYTEAVAEIEQILSRLRGEQIDVDTLAAEVKRATELIAQCKAQLTDVEQEQNGIYYYDRGTKYDMERVKAIFQMPVEE